MKHFEDFFNGYDSTKLYYQVWRPDKDPKAILQIVHGLGEYSTRYKNVVDALVPKGYIIYASDLRGHGKSEGDKAFVKKIEDYVEDQKIFTQLILEKEKESKLPIFLLGHSMGSIISKIYVGSEQTIFKGLILSGAGTAVGGSTNAILRAFAKLASILSPKSMISPNINGSDVSHDAQVIKNYDEDPLILKKITVRLGSELLRGNKLANKVTPNIQIPTLVQFGSEDKLILGGQELENLMTTKDKTIKQYVGLKHEVYNEIEEQRKLVLNDLLTWLNNHL